MPEQMIRNEYGEMVHVSHLRPRERPDAAAGGTPTQIANRYLHRNMEEMGLGRSRVEDDEAALADQERRHDPVVRFHEERDLDGSTVVVYQQTVMDLPIFEARMGVHIDAAAAAVTSAHSSMHGEVEVANPEEKKRRKETETLSDAQLEKLLGVELANLSGGRVERQVVYRFEPDQRLDEPEDDAPGCLPGDKPPPLELPALPQRFAKGKHYVVDEVLFRASRRPGEPPVHWRALVEPGSGAVLRLRALVSGVRGMVFARDPQTQTGATVSGASPSAALNPFRSSVTLRDLTRATPQGLGGRFVEVTRSTDPALDPPSLARSSGSFTFDARSDDFAAVNAYFHCDALFRTVESLGFDVAAYFGGTSFPVPVDFRAFGDTVNAQAPGNAHGDGLDGLRFGLVEAGHPVGMATANRVVWHEFGHALLWNHVHSANFGFAHSAGDSLGAILNDPGSKEPDRFDSFPWVGEGTPVGRRHDRAVADGWAWFGPQYNTQYQGEQVLSTTLFRLYRALGGDADFVAGRRRASRTAVYLIVKAIGAMTSATPYPQVFVTNLENADLTTRSFEGVPGGALHKVVRWAFEKQGLFQPDAMPGQGNKVSREGDPPQVDVYVDDGRKGEYGYRADHWTSRDLWVRHAADGGTAHQPPVAGTTNHLYVRVKNRGQKAAENVRVAAYHCPPGTGTAIPDDWKPMETPHLSAGGPVPAAGETVVGPFSFVPAEAHECLLAVVDADGDAANDTTLTGSIPESRFVPFDNNVAQRNVHPVAPTSAALLELLGEQPLWIRNPWHRKVACRLELRLPDFLHELGWELRVVSEGGARFELGPRQQRRVVVSLQAGREVAPGAAQRAADGGDLRIQVLSFLDDELSGGVDYPLVVVGRRTLSHAGRRDLIKRTFC